MYFVCSDERLVYVIVRVHPQVVNSDEHRSEGSRHAEIPHMHLPLIDE